MKEPLCKKGTATITINSEPPKPTTFEDLGYVQVVRCKDCVRRGTYQCPVYVGGDGMCSEPDDWFCADGKPKEENDGEDMARDTIKGEK